MHGYGILLIVLVVLFIRALKKKKEKLPGGLTRTTLSPYEEAIQALEALTVPVASTEVKPYYTALDGVFKRYLSRTFGWKAQQFTTSDVLIHLPGILENAGERSELAETLRLGDAVKFARYFPEVAWHSKAQEQIKKAIDTIHKIKDKS